MAPVRAIVKQLIIALAVTVGFVGLVEAMDHPGPSVAVVMAATSSPSTPTTAARSDSRTARPTSGPDIASTTGFGVTADYLGPIRRDSLDASTGISLTIPPANADTGSHLAASGGAVLRASWDLQPNGGNSTGFPGRRVRPPVGRGFPYWVDQSHDESRPRVCPRPDNGPMRPRGSGRTHFSAAHLPLLYLP